MDDHGLEEFRRHWQEELQSQALRRRRRPDAGARWPRRPEAGARGEQASGYMALAQGLLEGAGRPPAPRPGRADRRDGTSRSRSPPDRDAVEPEPLVDQLIRDLNEMEEVPFFDVQLPYELAINIFQYLNRRELGRCAQVSKTWKVIAEDEVLWYRLCQQEGHLSKNSISDYTCWKLIMQECLAKEHMLRTNWKNRKGAVSELEHVPDAVLCDVRSHDGVVIAGTGKFPIHRFEHDARIQALALSREKAIVATASAFDVVMMYPNEEGRWRIASEFEVQKLVDYLEIVPNTGRYPVAIATAGDLVYLLKAEDSARTLHYVYGQPATCLDVSATQAAFGVKSLGWVYEGNKILVYSLEAERCLSKLGNALGDFTCVNLRDSPPNIMVSGNMDRRVRLHDLRSDKIALSLSAHQLGVSAVQMDDWKIVSGGEEGLVCVWDYRMNQKLWEVHSRHPVRYISFNSHSLITANVPYEKVVRNADLDNFACHRRHRGLIHAYEFAVDQLAFQSALPVCRLPYDTMAGYSYDLALSFP
ncbi:Fbxw8 [Phodopus roborovskii]|uniref:Fbxw8 protein n=1 Tax=Phodopus roborovskii TaxID=109678 RepID=A0AAU9YU70_PHORO|nr:Fbxw8 [Phodopus roborovskii]